MRKLKASISMLLAIIMVISVLPLSVFASESDEGQTNYDVSVTDDSVNEANTDVIVPKTTSPAMMYFYTRGKGTGTWYYWANAFPLKAGTVTSVLDAAFCTDHDKKPPNHSTVLDFVGLMQNNEDLTTFTALHAYRCLTVADPIMNDDAYSELTSAMKLYAVNEAMRADHSRDSGENLDWITDPTATGTEPDYDRVSGNRTVLTKEQSTQFIKLAQAVYAAAKQSSATLPSAEITISEPAPGYYSGDNYILAEYTVYNKGTNVEATEITASLSATSSSAIKVSTSGAKVTVYTSANDLSNEMSWTVDVSRSLKARTMKLYSTGREGAQDLCVLAPHTLTATASQSDNFSRYDVSAVKIIKVDKADHTKKLAGAIFTLTNNDTGEVFRIGPTNSSGEAIQGQIPVGRYTLKEIVSPPKYELPDETWQVVINGGTTETLEFEIGNTERVPVYIDVTVKKQWVDNDNQDGLRNDVVLTLTSSDGNTSLTGIIPAGESTFTWEGLLKFDDYGELIEYYVSEATISGYNSVVVKGEDDYSFVVINTHEVELVSLTVTKIWNDNSDFHGARPDEVTMILTGSDNSVRTFSLSGEGDNWTYAFTSLPKYFNEGTEILYSVSELKVDGYVSTIVDKSNLAKEVTNTLNLGKLVIHKNSEDGIIDGQRFRVTGTSIFDKVVDIEVITDKNGIAEIDNLAPGEYSITEINVGPQYVAPQSQTIAISWGTTTEAYFTNKLNRMSITVIKTAEDGVLAGHKFRLTGTDYLGNNIDLVGVTDANGKIVFERLLKAEYTISEIEVDARYVIPEPQKVATEWGKNETVSFTNSLKRMSLKIAKTAEDGVLAGHKFRLTGTDYLGNRVDVVKATDDAGIVVFDGLLQAEYVITEIDSATRYVIPVEQNVNIDWDKDGEAFVNNTLKRMALTIRKNAEDGVLAGHKFRLTGTDYLGNEIDLIGVTDEDGKVIFNNLLAALYKVEEIDVNNRYNPCDAQEVDVEWDKDCEITFTNTLKRMSVTIQKVAEDNNLIGHKYTLTGIDFLGNKIDQMGITNDLGLLVFNDLLAGEYVVTEIEVGVHYQNPPQQTIIVNWGSDAEVTFVNSLKRMDLTVFKNAEDGVLAGHKFRLTGIDFLGNGIDITQITDETGKAVFKDLLKAADGTSYIVTEIDTNIRYVAPSEQIVEIDWGRDAEAVFENILKKWTLTATKTDSETGEPVEGASYGVFLNGILVDTYVTDENGRFSTKEYYCEDGYSIQELSPAYGYTLDPTVYQIAEASASACGDRLTALYKDYVNTPTQVVIHKSDITSGEAIPGATITITDNNGVVLYSGVTDENGNITAMKLPINTNLCFTETVAALGYIRTTEFFYFTINSDGTIQGDTQITNRPSEVTIKKVDVTTGLPLPGATIAIFDESGRKVFEDVTSSDGTITATKLLVGEKYTYIEIDSPDGFILNPTKGEFTINEDGTITGETTLANAPIIVTLEKKQVGTDIPVVGAVIELYDSEMNLIGQYTSDSDGKYIFRELTPSNYFYKEISTPAQYELDSTLHSFTVNADGSVDGDTVFYNKLYVPKTGDNTLLYGAIAFAALVCGAALITKRKRIRDIIE